MIIDIIFLALFGWAAYRGFTKGLILQAAMLAALIFGFWGARQFSGLTMGLITEHTSFTTQYLPLISFLITFIAIVIAIHFLARMLEKLLQAVALGFVNRMAGLLFSLIKTAFIVSAILFALNAANAYGQFLPDKELQKSKLYTPLSMFIPMLFPNMTLEDIPDSLPAINNQQVVS